MDKSVQNEEQSRYADNVERINQIIEQLRNKDCDIDDMLSLVNEAVDLIDRCQHKLGQTGIKINQALERLSKDSAEVSGE